jgi:hypothetical protein
VTEVFKGPNSAIGKNVFVLYPCAFPVQVGTKGVFFSAIIDIEDDTAEALLNECSRNGPVTDCELEELRAGKFGSCAPFRPPSCKTASGAEVPEGQTVQESCNTCTCSAGILSCTELNCPESCRDTNGVDHPIGEIWTIDCADWKCGSDGKQHLQRYSCDANSKRNTTYAIILSIVGGVSLAVIIALGLFFRRKLQALQLEEHSFDLSDSETLSSEKDEPPSYEFARTNVPNPLTVQQGRPAGQTTPMVLMSRTGEPMVVQVAYM